MCLEQHSFSSLKVLACLALQRDSLARSPARLTLSVPGGIHWLDPRPASPARPPASHVRRRCGRRLDDQPPFSSNRKVDQLPPHRQLLAAPGSAWQRLAAAGSSVDCARAGAERKRNVGMHCDPSRSVRSGSVRLKSAWFDIAEPRSSPVQMKPIRDSACECTVRPTAPGSLCQVSVGALHAARQSGGTGCSSGAVWELLPGIEAHVS